MLPNWLYGKSKSKLAELLGGGGTPSDYAEVKAQVTQNAEDIALLNNTVEGKVDWGDYSELGAVNLRNQDVNTKTQNGITFTVSTDKRITVSGVNDNTNPSSMILHKQTGFSKPLKVYGVPLNANNNYCCIEVYDDTSNSRIGYVTGSNPEVIIPVSNHTVMIRLYVWKNQDISTPMEFPVMITPLSYNGGYVPPAKTNKELTDDVANIEATIVQKVNPNSSGTTFDISFSNASYPRALVVSSYTYGTLGYWSGTLHYIPIVKNDDMASVTASNESSNGIRLTFSSGDTPTLIPLNTDASIWTITKVS